jgi:hypothetical protein
VSAIDQDLSGGHFGEGGFGPMSESATIRPELPIVHFSSTDISIKLT